MNDFKLNTIKGFIAEEIAKWHFEKMGFTVTRLGREHIDFDYTQTASYLRGKKTAIEGQTKKQDKTLDLYESTICKLPDFKIWKIVEGEKFFFRFIEVKERAEIQGASEFEYDFTVDELQISKYAENLLNLAGSKITDLKEIELFIYLICLSDQKKAPNIFMGKVKGQSENFKIKFFDPAKVNNIFGDNAKDAFKGLWGGYGPPAMAILEKINCIFRDDIFPLNCLGKDPETISRKVRAILEG